MSLRSYWIRRTLQSRSEIAIADDVTHWQLADGQLLSLRACMLREFQWTSMVTMSREGLGRNAQQVMRTPWRPTCRICKARFLFIVDSLIKSRK